MQRLQLVRIIIANSALAKLFYFDKSNQSLKSETILEHKKSKLKANELKSDEPGRYQKSKSFNEGTYAETTHPKTEESIHFAKELAEILSKEFYKNEFGKLLFIAPGNFQAEFSQAINKQLHDNTKFIDKDYTKLSDSDLIKHVKDLVKDINVF